MTAVDDGRRIAKVWFDALGIESGWMPVLINCAAIPGGSGPQRTEFEAEDEVPQMGETRYTPHRHRLVISPWMPKVNDLVLVLYFPVFNGDGVILGGVQPWK